MTGITFPIRALRAQMASAINVVIQIARDEDGRRRLVSLQEINGMEGDIITMQEIYHFNQTGIAPDGSVQGHFRATGVRPKFMGRLKSYGLEVADETFDPSLIYE